MDYCFHEGCYFKIESINIDFVKERISIRTQVFKDVAKEKPLGMYNQFTISKKILRDNPYTRLEAIKVLDNKLVKKLAKAKIATKEKELKTTLNKRDKDLIILEIKEKTISEKVEEISESRVNKFLHLMSASALEVGYSCLKELKEFSNAKDA